MPVPVSLVPVSLVPVSLMPENCYLMPFLVCA